MTRCDGNLIHSSRPLTETPDLIAVSEERGGGHETSLGYLLTFHHLAGPCGTLEHKITTELVWDFDDTWVIAVKRNGPLIERGGGQIENLRYWRVIRFVSPYFVP